jgi:HlyD family secretion protein
MFQRQIFRKESLQRLSNPEELDRLFVVVGWPSWLLLGTVGGLCVLAVVWGVCGRVPETVEGAGVLVHPGRVRALQVPSGGQVVELKVRAGQAVHVGDVIALLNLPELEQQRRQAEARLEQLRKSDAGHRELEGRRLTQEKAVRAQQEALLKSSIDEVTESTRTLVEETEKYIRTERERLERNLRETRALNQAVRQRLDRLRQLQAKHVETTDAVLTTETTVVENDVQLATLDLRIAELAVKEVENKQYRRQQENRVTDLKVQLNQLQVGATQLELEISQSRATRDIQIQEQNDRVQQLRTALEEQGQVKSRYSGRVLELSAVAGQVLQAGARLGAVEMDDASPWEPPASPLRVLAYFPVKSGKRLHEHMPVRVTPSTVSRARFGGILGTVTRVSEFPVTEESAATALGNPELVHALVQPGGMIEVEIELATDPDAPSGFRWTSAGPGRTFSAGTTAGVRVTVDEQAPITYVLPIFRTTVSGDGE